jgi:predicted permease
VRNAIIHPVVLPVLAGLVWNFTGLGLHPVVDQTLLGLGSAVVPVCLVLIGVSLAMYGLSSGLREALAVSAVKLLAMPALVLVVAHWGFGLTGTPLSVLVMMAALPTGNNALIFAQRYDTLQAESTLSILVSTALFAVTAALWMSVLGWASG